MTPKKLLFVSLLFLSTCSSSVPLDPETGKPLTPDAENLTYEEKINLQNEVIYRQQKEDARQAAGHVEEKPTSSAFRGEERAESDGR